MAKRRPKKKSELDFMPDWMRWVADYPFLHVLPKEMTDREEGQEADHLKKYACPSQMAANMLKQYRGQPERIERLFTRVTARYDKSNKKELDALAKQEEADIASLEATWAAILGAA